MANDQELIKEVYPISILRASQQNEDEGEHWISEDVIKKWTDNPQGVSPEYPYEFCCTRQYTYKNKDNPSEGKGWQPWDIKNISLWAHYGMNATPYQLLLGNPYESIYQIEASGATREAYVIIDGDGISTGEIILQGGYENKDQKFNLKIDELSILDPISNIEHHFEETNNYLTINLGDNWKCRFERSNNNGNPVIKIIGIGPNPESSVTPPSTIELAPTDSCFKCNLEGKYQKKIIIQAKNNQKNITVTATWTVTAIRDKNGDGIWRYQIMPNIDRVVRNIYYKRIGEDDKAVTAVKDAWNVGTANTLKFDLEKDTYGKSWKDINLSEQKCRIRIGRPTGNNEYEVLYNQEATSNPEIIDFDTVKSMFTGFLSDKSLLEPHMAQYTVEMLVEDPDYGEGFSVVDKCNLIFEYIVSESGKDGEDGEDGKDGTSSVFNLSNDSGSFAYDYKESKIKVKLNNNDKTTDIQYIVESNYKCCDSIKIGETLYEENTQGASYSAEQGSVYFNLTKNTEYWTLEITGITTAQYKSVFTIPITGIVLGKEVGTATFKMVGIKDLDENGVYAYRLACEHPYSTEDSSETDYLDIDVYKDALVEGFGYNTGTKVLVRIFSKKSGTELSPSSPKELGTVSCETHIDRANTGVSMWTVQYEHGVIVKLYAADKDYENTDKIIANGTTYYFTGEAEDIPWTAPQGPPGNTGEVDYEKLKKSINTISCNNDNIVVIPGNKYIFTFKDIAGSTISEITFNYSADSTSKLPNFFKKSEGESYFKKRQDGSYELNANPTIQADPFVGTISYRDSNNRDRYGEITYTWVGDANSDGVYYDYEIEPSAQVLGYTEVDGNLAFNIGEITITCKSVRHEGVLKTQTRGSGYILVESNQVEGNNYKLLDSNGQVTITLGESTGESGKLFYSKTDSFRVYWFTTDNDYATAAAGNTDIPIIEINGTTYYQVDSELIDVVPNTAIDATTNLQAYTGSGSFIIDPKELTATFKYKSDAPGYYWVRFNSTLGTSKDLYFKTSEQHIKQEIQITLPPQLIGSQKNKTYINNISTSPEDFKTPYTIEDINMPVENIAWITYPSVHVGIYKEKTFNTLLFEDTVVRTGLDGYYWNVDENGVVSLQSNGDTITSINQTANSIVSIASGVSPNLCEGAATDKTSLFDWVDGNTGRKITDYKESLTITAPNKTCEVGTFLSVQTSGTQHTYDASNFKLNEGYYGISLSPTSVTTGGTITIGYDGPLLYENYSAPSGKAIALSPEYNGKGIKFTASNVSKGSDYILSFYASSTEGSTIYVKANGNNTPYQFETTNSVKRYVLKLNNLQNEAVIIYNNSASSTLYISSIQFEKGSLVTDWKDYGQDVSSIIQEASSIRSEVEGFKNKYATKSEVKQTAEGIAMATVVNGIRTAGINIKNGDTEVTNGEINPNSGSVELTGQVIATNFMVKSGEHSISEIQKENSGIVMCITTWKNARELGTNDTIQNSGLSDNAPVFVIKSGNDFFVLNPLVLVNSSGEHPAIYTDITVYRYTSSSSMSVAELKSNKNPTTIYRYDTPSYKFDEEGKQVWIISGADQYIGRMCTDKNFDNKSEIDQSKLLQDFTLRYVKSISAPIHLYKEGFGRAIHFINMDIYEFKEYFNGEVVSTYTIFIGPDAYLEQAGNTIEIKTSNDKNTIYQLTDIDSLEYMSPQDRKTKTIPHKSDHSISVPFQYIETYYGGIGLPDVFITEIDGIYFNYILKKVDTKETILSKFLTEWSSQELHIFNENTINKYAQKDIELTYEDFMQGENIMSLQEYYIFD